jgi:Flp pilus assembly pilin Flp
MVALRTLLVRLAKEENGAEIIEYALVFGMIAVATILSMRVTGIKVAARWSLVSGAPW